MTRRAALAALMVILATACGEAGSGSPPPPEELQVFVASYDLAAGVPTRFLVGVNTRNNQFVSGGSVDMRFFFLGTEEAEGRQPRGEATGTFLPLPGEEGGPEPSEPGAVPASEGRGVYKVDSIEFDQPGFWEVDVTADFGGGDARTGSGAFEVLDEPLVPMPGDPALRTENLTVESKDAPLEAVDSRAATEGKVPDPELHRTTIADTIAAGRPALIVFATPVYCVSKFCGPITEMVEELAREYGDRAAFIHVEIWRDFQGRVVNAAAAEWLLREGSFQEPWVFAVGADGRIAARWDNVAAREEVEPWLQTLPRSG